MLKYHPSGTTDINVYDGDVFEEHNVQRQVGATGNKSDCLNNLLEQQGLSPVCINEYMTKDRLRTIRRRCKGLLLVIAAVDNDATRKMCTQVLTASDGDFLFVTPGNSDASDEQTDIRGNVLWYGRIGSDLIGIDPKLLFPNIEHPNDAIPRKGSCVENAVSTPQLISANSLAAAYTLTVVQNFLDDRMPHEASHLFFNGRTLSLTAN